MPVHVCSVSKLCPALCDPMDCSSPVSSFRGISQARILEWAAIFSSRRSSGPRDQIRVSCIGRWILYHWATWEAQTKNIWNIFGGFRCATLFKHGFGNENPYPIFTGIKSTWSVRIFKEYTYIHTEKLHIYEN